MIISKLRVLRSHGIQYIRDLKNVELTPLFRGRPEIETGISIEIQEKLRDMCPSSAIGCLPLSIDLGKCVFCKECALAHPEAIRFTNDYRMTTTKRENLIISEGEQSPIDFGVENLRPELRSYFKRALKLRQVSAGGDNSTEMELNATGNVNFDFRRYGVEFTASPRHADGMVITGAMTQNMSIATELCYNAIPEPKLIIAAGADAISGGLFAQSPAINRAFFSRHHVDIYMPGNPVHPMTFINGVMKLTGRIK